MLQGLQARLLDARAWLAQTAERASYDVPRLEGLEGEIVAALHRDGAAVTSLEALDLKHSAAEIGDIRKLFDAIKPPDPARRKQYLMHSTEAQVAAHPSVLLWGLHERLLRIVAGYLGLPPVYRGVAARIDVADGTQEETRNWHRDAEDFRIVKFIVYLSDVGPDDGPFEFIPKPQTPDVRKLRFVEDRVLDDDMAAAVPREAWRACTGPAGTVVVGDTCAIFHRGRPGIRSDRHTLFYNYNARQPRRPQYCQRMYDPAILTSRADGFSPLQRAAAL